MGGPSKKKRNRKRKNREGKLTAEEIHSMPTDNLCNYIENKAATEGARLQAPRGPDQLKKKPPSEDNNRRLQQQIIDDIGRLDNYTETYKGMSLQDLQTSLQGLKAQQRLKHNFGGRRTNDSHAAAIPSDHLDAHQQQLYVDENGLPCGGASCNYCSGQVVAIAEGVC